jgi:hypothetical protein
VKSHAGEEQKKMHGWTPELEAQAVHLYIDLGLSAREVAEKLGEGPTMKQVEKKMSSLKVFKKEKSEGKSVEDAGVREGVLARVRARVPEIAERIFRQSEELIEGSYRLAQDAIRDGDAKALNHATAAWERVSRTLASSSRGFERDKVQQVAGGVQVNVFFAGLNSNEIRRVSGDSDLPVS